MKKFFKAMVIVFVLGFLFGATCEVLSDKIARPIGVAPNSTNNTPVLPQSEEKNLEERVAAYIRKTNSKVSKEEALEWAATYINTSKQFNIPLDVLLAKDWVESRFNPRAVSSKGARGMAQFTVSTGKKMWSDLGFEYESAASLENPKQSIIAGGYYLRILLNQFEQNMTLALTAYNMGPSALLDRLASGEELEYRYATLVYAQARLIEMEVLK